MSPNRNGNGSPSQAMILAAGLGTRLRPWSDRVPKCMVPIAGKPLLEHTIGWLRKYGVTELVINLHHLADVVKAHFGDGNSFDVRISYSFEPTILGTAGAVKKAASFFDGPFYVWYGDNLSTCRLDRLWALHRKSSAVATLALFHRDDPRQSGIVEVDRNDKILRFLEKPAAPEIFSFWVNAGILVLEPRILEAVSEGVVDFGRDLFPQLLNQGQPLFGYRMSREEGLWWVDTPEDLQRVQQTWAGGAAC